MIRTANTITIGNEVFSTGLEVDLERTAQLNFLEYSIMSGFFQAGDLKNIPKRIRRCRVPAKVNNHGSLYPESEWLIANNLEDTSVCGNKVIINDEGNQALLFDAGSLISPHARLGIIKSQPIFSDKYNAKSYLIDPNFRQKVDLIDWNLVPVSGIAQHSFPIHVRALLEHDPEDVLRESKADAFQDSILVVSFLPNTYKVDDYDLLLLRDNLRILILPYNDILKHHPNLESDFVSRGISRKAGPDLRYSYFGILVGDRASFKLLAQNRVFMAKICKVKHDRLVFQNHKLIASSHGAVHIATPEGLKFGDTSMPPMHFNESISCVYLTQSGLWGYSQGTLHCVDNDTHISTFVDVFHSNDEDCIAILAGNSEYALLTSACNSVVYLYRRKCDKIELHNYFTIKGKVVNLEYDSRGFFVLLYERESSGKKYRDIVLLSIEVNNVYTGEITNIPVHPDGIIKIDDNVFIVNIVKTDLEVLLNYAYLLFRISFSLAPGVGNLHRLAALSIGKKFYSNMVNSAENIAINSLDKKHYNSIYDVIVAAIASFKGKFIDNNKEYRAIVRVDNASCVLNVNFTAKGYVEDALGKSQYSKGMHSIKPTFLAMKSSYYYVIVSSGHKFNVSTSK